MRIYKQTYSKPLPEGVKIISRKNGKFASFKNSKGHTTEARLTKSGDKILLETAHWHVEFEDNQGIRRRLKAYTNERASHRLADKIEDLLSCQANNRQPDEDLSKWLERLPTTIRDELVKLGLLDTERMAAGKPLLELISEFERSMQAKERTPKYIRETVSMVKRIFEGCKFKYWSDISPAKAENHLKDLRDTGIGYRRSNGDLTAIKSFCEWMVKSGYVSVSPLKHLTKLNTELDRRRERRAATPEEMRKLLVTTARGAESYGLSGYERALLYKLAVATGLRKNELRTLKVSAFDFDNLTLTVETCYSKHRREDILPLKADLATELQRYLTSKLPAVKAFLVTDKTCDMLKADLADANIAYKDAAGRCFDFHALRHTFITALRNRPTSVRQSLARHRSSAMTDRYTHINLHDERAAIEDLPDYTIEKQRAVKTGTDGVFLSKSCFQGAQMRADTDTSGKKNLDNAQKTQLSIVNEGAERTSNPKVAGSSPAGRVVHYTAISR